MLRALTTCLVVFDGHIFCVRPRSIVLSVLFILRVLLAAIPAKCLELHSWRPPTSYHHHQGSAHFPTC